MLSKKPRTFIGKMNAIIVGDDEKFSFEHRFINSISIGVSVISFISFIINLLLKLGVGETFGTLAVTMIYTGIYLLSRLFYRVELAKWLAILLSYLMLSVLWIKSAGSNGPVPYAFFLLFLSVVLLTEKIQRLLLLFLLVLSIIILFYIEFIYPDIIVMYKDELTRKLDMVISMLLYFILGGSIIIYAKSNYIKEKRNAQKSDELKSAFLANMSHEIRTPMNAIMGFTGLLKRGNLSQERKDQYTKIVDESADYLLRLVDDILDISKIEADQMDISLSVFDLDEMLKLTETAHLQIMPGVKKQCIKLSYENQGLCAIVSTDRARLEQILSNLIINAIKFTEKGEIKFGFQRSEDEITFYVKDTGIGIKKEYFNVIFERFRKLDNKNVEVMHRGTGIGLSIAKKVVELLGGKIWVESVYGKGSEFYFSLPLRSEVIVPFKNSSTEKTHL
jgi:signal transduction histidine kinase